MSRIELLVSAVELFLADRIRGSSSVGEVRDMAVFSQTAQSSLKRPGAQYLVGVLSGADPLVAQLIPISLFDGPRFDSLLPVSVEAELNVNQGSDWGKHE